MSTQIRSAAGESALGEVPPNAIRPPGLRGLSSLFTPSDMRYAASDVKFLDC